MNDRQLRNIINGLGQKTDGCAREDGFDITVASETMAVFCLASDLTDLKARLGRIIVAYNRAGEPITAVLSHAPGNGAAIGGIKVTTDSAWFAARPSGTEDKYKIYAESLKGADHLTEVQSAAKSLVDAALR